METISFQKALYEAYQFTTKNKTQTRYDVDCVNITEEGDIVGTNGGSIYIAKVDPKDIPVTGLYRVARGKDKKLFPKPQKKEINKTKPSIREFDVFTPECPFSEYSIEAKKCLCVLGTIFEPRKQGKFPPYKRVIPCNNTIVTLNGKEFLKGIKEAKKASILASKKEGVKSHCVNRYGYLFVTKDDVKQISGYSLFRGDFIPVISKKVADGGYEETAIYWDSARYALNERPRELRFNYEDDNSILDFRLKGRQIIVCPVRCGGYDLESIEVEHKRRVRMLNTFLRKA